MNVVMLTVLGMSLLLLFLELSTTGLEMLLLCTDKSSVDAKVVDVTCLEKPRSKGLVEISTDGVRFERIQATEDRETGYFPFQFLLFEKGRYQYVFQWSVDGKTYRGHYRHLKRQEVWKFDQSIPLRYKNSQPWKFAIDDPAVRTGFCVRVALYVVLIAGTIACFPVA